MQPLIAEGPGARNLATARRYPAAPASSREVTFAYLVTALGTFTTYQSRA